MKPTERPQGNRILVKGTITALPRPKRKPRRINKHKTRRELNHPPNSKLNQSVLGLVDPCRDVTYLALELAAEGPRMGFYNRCFEVKRGDVGEVEAVEGDCAGVGGVEGLGGGGGGGGGDSAVVGFKGVVDLGDFLVEGAVWDGDGVYEGETVADGAVCGGGVGGGVGGQADEVLFEESLAGAAGGAVLVALHFVLLLMILRLVRLVRLVG